MLIGVLVLIAAESDQPTILTKIPPILGWVTIMFGAVSLGIRRGAFTPRDR